MKDEICRIIENRNIRKGYYLLKLEAPYIASRSQAGNFVMVKTSSTVEPLLKRPFGIFNAQPPFMELYYEVIGKGTELLARLKPGDETVVLGPLGNSFPPLEGKNILAVAGGRGIAPLYYALRGYAANNRVFLIYGARSAGDLNLLEHVSALPLQGLFTYTDDGGAGKKGFVTSDIREIIRDNHIGVTISCGPDAMFEALARVIGPLGCDNYVSMEAIMGCGFGICYSCAVKMVDNRYKKVCSDGPVFRMEEIAWGH